jgi:hypothetical protein
MSYLLQYSDYREQGLVDADGLAGGIILTE